MVKYKIELDTIDNATNCNASFVKLDIEGFEEKALSGAVNTIKKCKPKMAISVYHKSDDMWSYLMLLVI
jgi:FkbM family methyltransferase